MPQNLVRHCENLVILMWKTMIFKFRIMLAFDAEVGCLMNAERTLK